MKEFERVYKAGFVSLVSVLIFVLLQFIVMFFDGVFLIMMLNVTSVVFGVLFFICYFMMMRGFVLIGRKYSVVLKRVVIGILGLIILGIILMVFLVYSNINVNDFLIVVLSWFLLLVFVAYAILKIIYGVYLRRLSIQSSVKDVLGVFSVFEGVSILTVAGLIFWPYFAFMTVYFQSLFLKEVACKKYEANKRRNMWCWLLGVLYLIFVVLTFLYYLVKGKLLVLK